MYIISIVTTVCPQLATPANGGVNFSKNRSSASFYCKRGFTLKGDKILDCIDGKWNSPPPICVTCPQLKSPANGRIRYIRNKIRNQIIAYFQCSSGFALKGCIILTCVDGKWSHSPPICVKQ